jgi:hypothetical protein
MNNIDTSSYITDGRMVEMPAARQLMPINKP